MKFGNKEIKVGKMTFIDNGNGTSGIFIGDEDNKKDHDIDALQYTLGIESPSKCLIGGLDYHWNFGFLDPNSIRKVIFNDPATIVYWGNGDKTVVKCHDEDFDQEKGLAMAICKRFLGYKYHNVFKEFIPEENKDLALTDEELKIYMTNIKNRIKRLNNNMNELVKVGKGLKTLEEIKY